MVELHQLVQFQLQLGESARTLVYKDGIIKVVISVDSTPIWRASATRADIFVDVYGDLAEVQQSIKRLIDCWVQWQECELGDVVGNGWGG